MRLCELTSDGMEIMRDWLDTGASGNVPAGLLEPGKYAKGFEPQLTAGDRTFQSKAQWAHYSLSLLGDIPQESLKENREFWCWLTLRYFDQVCPRVDGKRKLRDRAHYIPSLNDFRSYYRHLLMGPWSLAVAHRNSLYVLDAILAGELHSHGELIEQIASQSLLVTAEAVLGVTRMLYYDESKKSVKRGAASQGAGSVRRLTSICRQLDLTYDLQSISAEKLLSLLPREFDSFRPR